ncbi:MAG TPA: glycosyltransferase family 4 protein [Vicinamibacterales bacterium]|nr:glycosyltransferase family 4 protein [Vicinamibacterales bacterium]
MRILYFADIRFPLERANGIQTMETCHALAERGHEVRLVVRPDTQGPARDPFEFYGLPRSSGLIVERAPAPRTPPAAVRMAYLGVAVGRAVGRLRADAILTRDLGLASLLLRIPRGARPPLVYESHGYAPDVAAALPDLVATARPASASKRARLERREARVWRSAEGYVTITQGLADTLCERYGPRPRLAVVPDGTRLRPEAQPASCGGTRPVTVGYAGHLYAWKGVDVLLEALARVPEVRGLIVGGHGGEPDLARVKALSERLGLAGRLTLTGLVAPPRVAELLRSADILVLPNQESAISTRFTSPLKLFEYMAACRAIVASDLPAVREVVTHETDVLLAAPGDPESLAGAIRRLARDEALRERLAAAARARVEHYTWERRAARLEALLREVAGASR